MNKKDIIYKSIILIITIIGLIWFIFGEIVISIPFVKYNDTPLYKVFINHEQINVGYNSSKIIPIIPSFLSVSINDNGIYKNVDESSNNYIGIKLSQPIYLDIESYICYEDVVGGKRGKCDSESKEIIKRENTKYKIKIIRDDNNQNVLYEGDYVRELTNYLKYNDNYIIYIYETDDDVNVELKILLDRMGCEIGGAE